MIKKVFGDRLFSRFEVKEDYFCDLIYNGEELEVWLHHKEYGFMSFVVGIPVTIEELHTTFDIVALLKDLFEDDNSYFDDYEMDIEILEDGREAL